MEARELSVRGLWEFGDAGSSDTSGLPYDADAFRAAVGPELAVGHLHHAQGLLGVIHGLRWSPLPAPAEWTYLFCSRGAVLVVVADLRTGSPTFGRHEARRLDAATTVGLAVTPGLAHGFTALEDDSILTHLGSRTYRPEKDRGVHALDPTLRLPWPSGDGAPAPSLSADDAGSPTLADLKKSGRLPTYDAWRTHDAKVRAGG